MRDQIMWGTESWVDGLRIPEPKTLREQAARGGDHLLNAVGRLIHDGSDAAYALAEELLETYS
jgi:hypothetical protein